MTLPLRFPRPSLGLMYPLPVNPAHPYTVACILAETWHRDQKWGDLPYVSHLSDVTAIVSCITEDITAMTIAVLHDCMEDQGIHYDTLAQVFGNDIADAVRLLTITDEDKADAGGRKNAQKRSYPELAKNPVAALVKVADRYANTVYGMSKNNMYRKEHQFFRDTLYPATKDMGFPDLSAQMLWDEIDRVLGNEA